MTNKEKIDEDKYFRIKLESQNGLISIQENKHLSPDEYHLIESTDTNNYQILVEVSKTIETKYSILNVPAERYQTHEFQNVTYQEINDFNIDGFSYDKEGEVVFYGWIYGIYAESDGTNYYDVITGEQIPREIIDEAFELETAEAYLDMLEDLKLIEEHKACYINTIEDIFSKLTLGANNRKLARERYMQKYEAMKKARKENMNKRMARYQESREKARLESAQKKEEVTKLLYKIRNNN